MVSFWSIILDVVSLVVIISAVDWLEVQVIREWTQIAQYTFIHSLLPGRPAFSSGWDFC